MIRLENDCVGCEYCKTCGRNIVAHHYCDECGDECELYHYDDKELCSHCLVKCFARVEGSY